MHYLLIITGSLIALAFLYASIVSILEKEYRAARVSFLIALITSTPFFVLAIIPVAYSLLISYSLLGITAVSLLVLFIPTGSLGSSKEDIIPGSRIDERDIMFSRMRYEPGSERFEEYYNHHPEYREVDDRWREKPGLMKKGTTLYDPLQFGVAAANFTAVECFHEIVDGDVSPDQVEIVPDEITGFLKHWILKQGAVDVGFTLLKDYHKYTHVGRGEEYGNEVLLDHRHAIALTVEMDKEMMDSAPYGPAVMESSEQYLRSGTIATQVALFIRNLGYPARAHIDGNYRVVCPLVAKDAGLGEIGRMGLLMTPQLGPRVRIAVITTDIPLTIDESRINSSVLDFCKICKKCADICPSQAIPFDGRKDVKGSFRWQINSEKCFHYWCISGTDCGRCMTVCPYSHPDNLLHRFIRFGVRNSFIFRRFALWMDDLFYGRKPAIKPVPDWIPGSKSKSQTTNN